MTVDAEPNVLDAAAEPAPGTAGVESAPASADDLEPVEPQQAGALIEALIFVSGEPLGAQRLSEVTGVALEQVEQELKALEQRYAEAGHGFALTRVAGQYQFRSRPEFAPYIRELKSGAPRRLSPAALETLAVVAYRQPVVKSDVEKIRGVDATPTLKTLLERGLIKIVGRRPTVGQPALYGTTDEFLKMFGLASLGDLPSLRDLRELERDPGETEPESELPSEPVEDPPQLEGAAAAAEGA